MFPLFKAFGGKIVLWIKMRGRESGFMKAKMCGRESRIFALPQVLYVALGKSLSFVCESQKWGGEKSLCSPGSWDRRPAAPWAHTALAALPLIWFGSTGPAGRS